MNWVEQGFWVSLIMLAVCLALPAISFVFGWGRKQ
jgi:hypothetical protein